jgi:superfamily II RNA helicase
VQDAEDLRRRQIPYLKDTLAQLYERDMLPAIWFIFSRKGCDQAVAKLKEAALLTPEEEEQVRLAVEEFREKYPDAVREHAVGPLNRGLAAHHAGEGFVF